MRRAYKYRLYVSDRQAFELEMMLDAHRKLYNASLAERELKYQVEGVSVRFREQRSRFKSERLANPCYRLLSVDSAHQTMKRLDLAYQAAFRRIKSGEEPGFPHSRRRYSFNSVNFLDTPE